ncbi:MAG: UbiD family decarboxylase, partial [Acidobacteriota bacterium]
MAYSDLREFIAALEKAGELKRIPFEVDPYLEITEFADRAVKGGGPALLFEKPKGSSVPLLINSLASERRMQIALQVEEFQQIADRISEYLQMQMPQGLLGKLSMLPKLAEMGSFFPKTVSSAPCQEVVLKGDQIDLGRLPVLTCWPQDGGPYITLPMVFTKNPETGKRNCGMYRMQVYDARTTGMHWQAHKQGAEHYRRRFKAGETRMDVAVAIGADPAVMYSAILPLPPDLDEMMIAGFLRKKPVEMVQCLTVDVDVPANAEYVLEGYVEMGERRTEGPFGDHTGYYSLEDEY